MSTNISYEIGESVYYQDPGTKQVYYGIVQGNSPEAFPFLVPVNWEENFCGNYGLPKVWNINKKYLNKGTPPPPLTTEQKVQQKIKTLWNNSTWVKTHPEQAYS